MSVEAIDSVMQFIFVPVNMLRVIGASCHAASDRCPFSILFVVGCRSYVEVLRVVTKNVLNK